MAKEIKFYLSEEKYAFRKNKKARIYGLFEKIIFVISLRTVMAYRKSAGGRFLALTAAAVPRGLRSERENPRSDIASRALRISL